MQAIEFKNIADKMKDRMFRLAYRFSGNQEDAKDIVQDSMIKIWKNFEKLQQVENKEAWCMTVTRNVALDKLRSRKSGTSDINEHYDISDKGATPDRLLEVRDSLSRVMQVLNSLPENHRTILHLRDVEGYTYKEISEMTGFSIDKVKVYLFRGRQKLKQKLVKITV